MPQQHDHHVPKPVGSWYSITNETTSASEPSRAKVRIYDAIGGWWGTNAADFVAELDALDVDELELRINSPGGAVWDGLAIMNSLKAHRAKVTVIVDGLAASAASVVAMAGDEIVMAEGAQMMIHRASAGAWGNAEYLRDTAGVLEKIDQNLAGVYARRAGGSQQSWLDLMAAETWYNADEAVAAGLADRAETVPDAVDAEASFDLSLFNYAGRSQAPAPRRPAANLRVTAQATTAAVAALEPPAEPVETITTTREESAMSDLIQGLRERLGLPADAQLDDAGLLNAVDAALAARPESFTPPEGTVLLDATQLADLQAAAEEGRQARQQQVRAEREQLVTAAVQDGRIPPARKEHWVNLLEVDDEGGRQALASLTPGTIPLAPVGYTGGVDEASDEARLYTKAWGTTEKKEA